MSSKSGINREDVEIAIFCALPIEARAIKNVMDNNPDDPEHSRATKTGPDENAYTLGKMGDRTVVLVHLPSVGKISSTLASTHLKHTYPNIELAILAGICGGVPKDGTKVTRNLGDVVIGTSVHQFDMRRLYPDQDQQSEHSRALLGEPSPEIVAFIKKLQSSKETLLETRQKTISTTMTTLGNKAPELPLWDVLYDANHWHMHHNKQCCTKGEKICEAARRATCEELQCDSDKNNTEHSLRQTELEPKIHFGQVGCGDVVMKSGTDRDNLAKQKRIIALDMEGAGIAMHEGCLFVKSISDYADSHKNKVWQEHASLASAACTKAIIGEWISTDKEELKEMAQKIQNNNIYGNANVGMVTQDATMRDPTFNFGCKMRQAPAGKA
ncbi:hypothetical protein FPOA_00113 [Fusarium poae]|uniref:Nucleoside phosphorylase domain-containing protein n=1 Tax=Fusarium poae TaxID=36050 RepID=A0A1B8B0F8_FUSPO|nr:hypothetical protein FPOA_00113 [Fusarium poae]